MASTTLHGSAKTNVVVLDVWTSYFRPHFTATAGISIAFKLHPVPSSIQRTAYFAKTLNLSASGSSSSSGSGSSKVVPLAETIFTLEYFVKKMAIEGSGSSSSTGAGKLRQYNLPFTEIYSDYFVEGSKTKLHGSVRSRLHQNPPPFGLHGTISINVTAPFYRDMKTSILIQPRSGSQILNSYVGEHIALTGNSSSTLSMQILQDHKLNPVFNGRSKTTFLRENAIRMLLRGSSETKFTVGTKANYKVRLQGSAVSSGKAQLKGSYYYVPHDITVGVVRERYFDIYVNLGVIKTEWEAPIDISVRLGKLFPIRVNYSKSHVLGTVHYPYAPQSFTGIRPLKLSDGVLTEGGYLHYGSTPQLADSLIEERWNLVEKYFFDKLQALYKANNGGNLYWYRVDGDDYRYQVEIVSLTGTPYKEDYVADIVLKLKPYKKELLSV